MTIIGQKDHGQEITAIMLLITRDNRAEMQYEIRQTGRELVPSSM